MVRPTSSLLRPREGGELPPALGHAGWASCQCRLSQLAESKTASAAAPPAGGCLTMPKAKCLWCLPVARASSASPQPPPWSRPGRGCGGRRSRCPMHPPQVPRRPFATAHARSPPRPSSQAARPARTSQAHPARTPQARPALLQPRTVSPAESPTWQLQLRSMANRSSLALQRPTPNLLGNRHPPRNLPHPSGKLGYFQMSQSPDPVGQMVRIGREMEV